MNPSSDKLTHLPARPGVYLMRDKAGKVIYVAVTRANQLRMLPAR